MGKKYIIELERGTHIFVLGPEGITHIGEPDVVYNTVDGMQIGDAVINAKPYTEPDLEQVRKEAYDEGYDDAKGGYENGFENGMIVAWNAARKIEFSVGNGGLLTDTIAEIFGTPIPNRVLRDFTASEAIEKIREYEDKQKEEIKVGDEVVSEDDEEIKAVVIDEADEAGVWFLLSENGCVERMDSNLFHRTGRTFPEIDSVIDKMRSST